MDGDKHWPLKGKDAVAEYLTSRFEFLSSEKKKGRNLGALKLALIDYFGKIDQPCLVFELEGVRQGIYLIEVDSSGKISEVQVLSLIVNANEARYVDDHE